MYVCVRFTYVCTNVHGKGHMSTREKGGLMLMSSSLARLVLPRYGVWCVGHLVLSVRVCLRRLTLPILLPRALMCYVTCCALCVFTLACLHCTLVSGAPVYCDVRVGSSKCEGD